MVVADQFGASDLTGAHGQHRVNQTINVLCPVCVFG